MNFRNRNCSGDCNEQWRMVEKKTIIEEESNSQSDSDSSQFSDSYSSDTESPSNCDTEKDCSSCTRPSTVYVSVKNPQTELIIPETSTAPPFNVVGINDTNQLLQVNNETIDLILWSDLIVNSNKLFDKITGTYTVPMTGYYQVELTVNYETSVPLPVSTTLNNVPTIEIYDVCTNQILLSSQFPTLYIIVPIPPFCSESPCFDVPVTSILSKAQVIINAVICLKKGQRIRIRANTNGLQYTPPECIIEEPIVPKIDFSPDGVDTTFSIYKLDREC